MISSDELYERQHRIACAIRSIYSGLEDCQELRPHLTQADKLDLELAAAQIFAMTKKQAA